MTPSTSATAPSVAPTPSLEHRADRLRQPLESPCPPSTPAGAAGLSARHLREIKTIFKIFDPDLTGFLDINSFEAMARSLGFRLSREYIAGMIDASQKGERSLRERLARGEGGRRLDLAAAIRILASEGYARRSEGEETSMYFRIFDGDNKGHITLDDLKRVQKEVKDAERELDISGKRGESAASVGDASLRAMIQQFDLNGDGSIDEEEFRKILEPVLSPASS